MTGRPTAPGRSRSARRLPVIVWTVAGAALVVATVLVALLAMSREPAPDGLDGRTPPPAPESPGLDGGETFSMESDTEQWVSGVLIEAHSGFGGVPIARQRAVYDVIAPGMDEIKIFDRPGVVVEIPGWGRLTVEEVEAEPYAGDGVEPPAVLHFRAVTDEPLRFDDRTFPGTTG